MGQVLVTAWYATFLGTENSDVLGPQLQLRHGGSQGRQLHPLTRLALRGVYWRLLLINHPQSGLGKVGKGFPCLPCLVGWKLSRIDTLTREFLQLHPHASPDRNDGTSFAFLRKPSTRITDQKRLDCIVVTNEAHSQLGEKSLECRLVTGFYWSMAIDSHWEPKSLSGSTPAGCLFGDEKTLPRSCLF